MTRMERVMTELQQQCFAASQSCRNNNLAVWDCRYYLSVPCYPQPLKQQQELRNMQNAANNEPNNIL